MPSTPRELGIDGGQITIGIYNRDIVSTGPSGWQWSSDHNLCFLQKTLIECRLCAWPNASFSLLSPSLLVPSQQEKPKGWLCLTAPGWKICVSVTQSILYLFWILSSDIKAADINLQGQKLALMDPIKVIIDGSCVRHHCDLSKSLHRYQYC